MSVYHSHINDGHIQIFIKIFKHYQELEFTHSFPHKYDPITKYKIASRLTFNN